MDGPADKVDNRADVQLSLEFQSDLSKALAE